MNGLIEAGRFRGELAGWAVRGFLCAVPSAFFALIGGFNRPNEWVAMAVGFIVYVVVFAGFCSAHAMRRTEARQRLVRTLKMSAWLKAAQLLVVFVAWALVVGEKISSAAWLAWSVVPDIWLGLGSVSFAQWLAGLRDHIGMKSDFELGHLNSFGWTLLTTLLQGALISGLLFALAGTFLGCRRLWISLEGKPITPARSAG